MSALLQLGRATLEIGTNSVRAIRAGVASQVLSKGKEAFNESLKQTGEPCPVGDLIVEHPHDNTDLGVFGWHAGPMHQLEDQVARGEMDDVGADLYFGTRQVAAHFGGREVDSVILLLAGSRQSEVGQNDQFGTNYFVGGSLNGVRVLAAHRISPMWLRYASNVSSQTPSMQRAVLALRATADAMKANLER